MMVTCLTGSFASSLRRSNSVQHTRPLTRSEASRRDGLLMMSGIVFNQVYLGNIPALADEAVPPAAPVCDGPDCLGYAGTEGNETLNACSMNKISCVSTMNDDESHFMAPWEFDVDSSSAIDRLLDISTGGAYLPGPIDTPFGVSSAETAAFIAKGVLAVVQNGDMPERPKRKMKNTFVPFNGKVVERQTTPGGSEYVRITFYPQETDGVIDPVDVIDAEFLFLKGDSIVNVRAVSRQQPETDGFKKGELGLSFTNGIVLDKNVAKRQMERLRKALQWNIAPVLTDFDPKFNAEAPVIVEKFFQPFNERNQFRPSGEAYPAD